MTSLEEDQAVINYYLRRELFQHAQAYCDAKLKKKLSEPTLIFWRAFTLIKQERATEAIRELEQLQDKRDLVLAFPLAAMYAHENCKLVDREAVDELQAKLTIAASNPNVTERALVLAGLLQMHAGHTDSAREYFRSALKTNGTSASANVCLGWLDLTSGQDSTANKSNMWFDKALDKNPRDVEASIGLCKGCMIVFYQSFLPAYIERMYMYLEMALWDQVVEAAQQITAISPDNVDALTLICLNELCREGGAKMAAAYISNIFDAISRTEPRNHVLLYTTARPFVRLANKNPQVLDQCQRLVERAISLKSSTSDYHVELGYILFLQGTRAGSRSRARECYKAAATLDAHNVSALEGIIRCQIFSNEFDEAQEQLDIFNELQKSMGHRAEIAYLNAILSWKKHRDSMRRLQFLKEAVELQLQVVNSRPLSPEYYVSVNPTFLIEIVKDYMEHCISDGASDSQDVVLQPVLRIAQDLLEVICRIVPASTESLYFLAKAKLLLGDKMAAEIALSSCLKLNEANSKAHLLMAEIHMSSELFKPAIASLEMALSYDFEIRHRPLFHLLKARALKLQGSFDEALSVLKTAMTLPAVKDLVKGLDCRDRRSEKPAPAQK
nr:Tetratricopeptide repeat protein 21B [Polyrhizophydium stewartii]